MSDTVFDCNGIFDSHAHYFDSRFDGADIILEGLFEQGLDGVINVGTNVRTSFKCIEQARRYKNMYAVVGLHPEDIRYLDRDARDELSELEAMLTDAQGRAEQKIVGIGEIGLDYHYEEYDKAKQQECFEAQLSMAERLDLPVVIHDREAHGDCFETVIKYPGLRGVFHSFSGSAEMASELVRRGWYISFSGVLTFKNARKTVEVAERIPMERILIETDCPYLAPHPYRGQLNHSGLMCLTAQRLAEIKNIPTEDVVQITRENAYKLFNI